MKIKEVEGLTLPKKREEQFLKIDFKPLFSQEFKKAERLGVKNLEIRDDDYQYGSILFDIAKKIDGIQKKITISEDIKKPYMIVHVMDEDDILFTNSFHVHIKKGVRARIVDIISDKCNRSAIIANRLLTIEEGADVEYLKLQDVDEGNSCLYNVQIEQGENSRLDFTNLDYGDGFIVNSYYNEINHKNINYRLNGLAKLLNNAKCSNIIKTVHNARKSISEINYKNTLQQKSRGVLKVMSVVNHEALFTKAFQNCHNILLSDDAVIHSQPHLEIYIDELEASHGVTTGSLDKDQLLYLQSRGISKQKAHEMLLTAFEKEVIESIKDEKLKDVARRYSRNDYVQG